MSRKEEELVDVRDGEGFTDKYGNSCMRVGEKYTIHKNSNGTFIISKKIPSFRYLRVKSYKNREEAYNLFDSLEKDFQKECVVECVVEVRQEDQDRINIIRDKLVNDKDLTVEEFEFLEMG